MCAKPGKRTKEHVFGNWLADLFGVKGRNLTMYTSTAGPKWTTRGMGVVVDACAACNNGWMSNLEGRFSTAFSAAILGHPTTFTTSDLTTLAHWATKTAVMLQPHLDGMGEVAYVPEGHLSSLPSGPPIGTRVWLGAYAPVTRFVFWQNVPMSPGNEPLTRDSRRTGYVMLMTIGHVMIVVLALDAAFADDLAVVGLPNGVFRPVWPAPTALGWPDGVILNDQGVAAFWPPKGLVAFGG